MLLIIGGTWAVNYFTANKPLQHVLDADPRNYVCKANAHFEGWINPKTLVFDVTSVSGDATRLDVFRAFLEYAEAIKDRHFTKVVLPLAEQANSPWTGTTFRNLAWSTARKIQCIQFALSLLIWRPWMGPNPSLI